MKCPNCGFEQEDSPECLACGVIFAKYAPAPAPRRRAPAPSARVASSPSHSTVAPRRATSPASRATPAGRSPLASPVESGSGGAFALLTAAAVGSVVSLALFLSWGASTGRLEFGREVVPAPSAAVVEPAASRAAEPPPSNSASDSPGADAHREAVAALEAEIDALIDSIPDLELELQAARDEAQQRLEVLEAVVEDLNQTVGAQQ